MVRRAPAYEPLTPTAFLRTAALVHADRPALVDGGATLVPLNHRLAVAELVAILEHAGATLPICDRDLAARGEGRIRTAAR
jgi:hypothetical protein